MSHVIAFILYLLPFSLFTTVHMYGDGVLVRADHSLNVILIERPGKVLEREGPILKQNILTSGLSKYSALPAKSRTLDQRRCSQHGRCACAWWSSPACSSYIAGVCSPKHSPSISTSSSFEQFIKKNISTAIDQKVSHWRFNFNFQFEVTEFK